MTKIKIKITKDDDGNYWAQQDDDMRDWGRTLAESIGDLYAKIANLEPAEILGRLILGNLESVGVEIDDSELPEAIVDGVKIVSVEVVK